MRGPSKLSHEFPMNHILLQNTLSRGSLSTLLLGAPHTMSVNFFRVEKQFLRVLWFWPSPELMTTKEVFKITFNSLLMMVALSGEVFFAYATFSTDFPLALNALGPVASKLSMLLKVLVLYYNRMEVMEVLDTMKSWMDTEMGGAHFETFRKPVRIANLATVLLAGNIAITCIYYSILPLFSMLLASHNDTPYEPQTPFKMLCVSEEVKRGRVNQSSSTGSRPHSTRCPRTR